MANPERSGISGLEESLPKKKPRKDAWLVGAVVCSLPGGVTGTVAGASLASDNPALGAAIFFAVTTVSSAIGAGLGLVFDNMPPGTRFP